MQTEVGRRALDAEMIRALFVVLLVAAASPAAAQTVSLTFGCEGCRVAVVPNTTWREVASTVAACTPNEPDGGGTWVREWAAVGWQAGWMYPDMFAAEEMVLWTALNSQSTYSPAFAEASRACLLSAIPTWYDGFAVLDLPAGEYVGIGTRYAEGEAGLARITLAAAGPVTAAPQMRLWCAWSCPWVYVESGGEHVRVGEILVDLRSAAREATQTIDLPTPDVVDGRVHVRIAEEELETTYLNYIVLFVDSASFAPLGAAEALGALDDQYVELSLGDAIDLEFAVGTVPEGARFTLRATGYYVPYEM